jgi:release factor glutamine methyltransferase
MLEHLRQNAARDALLLLLHVTGLTRADVYTSPDRELTPPEAAAYDAAIKRRLHHEPIQYITGEQEFFGLPLRVTPAVLIPRPETEHLVEAVISEVAHQPSRPLTIVDVGTGSGAIAIALAKHLPNAHISAVDVSPEALAVARANAEQHGLADRIQFVESDLLHALHPTDRFDAVVSNPPYVPESDRGTLHPQVSEYEPANALFAGNDGLAVYRRLIPQASAALKPGGLLAMEIGHGQRDALANLLFGWNDVHFVNDLRNIPRVALARRP